MMQRCRWGLEGCINTEKCYLCTSEGYYYRSLKLSKKQAKGKAPKKSSRKGSLFEEKNHERNEALLTGSRATPNSGAGSIKGDEQIFGLVTAMEELKQQTKVTAKGKKSFSINKDWLDKLEKEAKNHEFWYLKFTYDKYGNKDIYVVTSQEMIMSMILTMAEDRKALKIAKAKQNISEKRARLFETEIIKLKAEIDLLKATLAIKQIEGEDI